MVSASACTVTPSTWTMPQVKAAASGREQRDAQHGGERDAHGDHVRRLARASA
jgi:hypothetical protein